MEIDSSGSEDDDDPFPLPELDMPNFELPSVPPQQLQRPIAIRAMPAAQMTGNTQIRPPKTLSTAALPTPSPTSAFTTTQPAATPSRKNTR